MLVQLYISLDTTYRLRTRFISSYGNDEDNWKMHLCSFLRLLPHWNSHFVCSDFQSIIYVSSISKFSNVRHSFVEISRLKGTSRRRKTSLWLRGRNMVVGSLLVRSECINLRTIKTITMKKKTNMEIACAGGGNIECSNPNAALQPISNLSDVLKNKTRIIFMIARS